MPTTLSNGFGTNGSGKVITPIGTADDYGYSAAIQSDGKIVVAGYAFNGTNYDFAVTRYDINGNLDSTFGNSGKVVTAVGNADDFGQSVVIQSDGKIVVAGSSNSTNSDFALVRYDANGVLDTTFGNNGKVVTPIGSANDYGRSVVMKNDGKIIVAGYAFNGTNYDFAVTRYDINGNLDSTFGTSGKVITPIGVGNDYSYSAAIQSDGKIIVAGYANAIADFALTRYDANGILDTTFGTNGKVITAVGTANDYGRGVVIQNDGKIIVAGYVNANNDFALTRYDANGILDTAFGNNGKVITAIGTGNDAAQSVVLQSDGKIIVAGYAYNGLNYDFAIIRYDVNGILDASFGNNGKVVTPIGTGHDYGYSVVIQNDGKIVVAGQSSNGINVDFALVRYNSDGSLDVDNLPPTVTITSTGSLTNNELQTIIGTGEAGTTVQLFDNDSNTALVAAIVAANGTWSANVTLAGQGTHSLIAKDTDIVGNVGSSSAVIYTLDTLSPIVSVISQTVKNTDNVIAQSNETGFLYLVKDSVVVTDLVSITNAPDNNFNAIAISEINTNVNLPATGLVDGVYKFYATDELGNLSSATIDTITIDSTAPIATITGQTVKNTENIIVQSNETGIAYLVKATLTQPTTLAELTALETLNDSSVNHVAVTANVATNLSAEGLADGIYNVYAVDALGNLSSMATNTITIHSPIVGTANADTLTGTTTNDTIVGGAGKDTLTGGTGSDLFVYQTASDSTVQSPDTIKDFAHSTDKIDFSIIASVTNVQGLLKAASLKVAPHSVAWTIDASGNTQVYANTSNVAEFQTKADIKIVLTGHPTLDLGDFSLFVPV